MRCFVILKRLSCSPTAASALFWSPVIWRAIARPFSHSVSCLFYPTIVSAAFALPFAALTSYTITPSTGSTPQDRDPS
jgi:hypothetical protein